jgi:hypothetical protein
MKKIFLSLAAMLTFGIASAQISPAQPQQTQPDPANTATDANTKAKKDANVQNDVVNPSAAPQGNDVQPRKDELKTRDHVKSTPDPSTVKDDGKKKDPEKKGRKRKS